MLFYEGGINPAYKGTCTQACGEYNENNVCTKFICQETGKLLPDNYKKESSECSALFNNVINETLKISKICNGNALANGCIPEFKGANEVTKEIDPECETKGTCKSTGEFSTSNIANNYPAAVLQDGSYIIKYGQSNWEKSESPIMVFDINGKKGPNKWGYDIYGVIIYGNITNGISKFQYYTVTEPGGKKLDERRKAVGLN